MKYDEFAFLNQQLAGLLRDGLPLEGALRQLCAQMQRGSLRAELQQLQADLTKGMRLKDALAARKLPPLYQQMLLVGVQSDDLPGVLLLLADYYHKANSIGTRLKGLMIYPVLVLVVALGVSLLFSVLFGGLLKSLFADSEHFLGAGWPANFSAQMWVLPGALALITIFAVALLAVPSLRRIFRWRLPAFKEASLAQFASAAAILLKKGGTLNDALALLQQLETGTPAGQEVSRWQTRLSQGRAKFADFAAQAKVFPPLFVWLVGQAGEDLAGGFKQAAEIYYARTLYRIELLLYAALPVSTLLLGCMIVGQMLPAFQVFKMMLQDLGSVGDGSGW
jgi:type II secretory pathway component PulF